MAELKQFKLPDVGEGLTEAEIVKWHVHPGEAVRVNQTIVEIETAKAVVELPCPYAGVVAELLVEEGQTVDVGTPIITVDTAPATGDVGVGAPGRAEAAGKVEEAREAVAAPPAEGAVEPGLHGSPAPKAQPERQPVLVGYGVKMGAATRRPRKARPGAPAVSAPRPEPARPAEPTGRARFAVLAKPPVRKLAKDLGVDLATVTGSGPGGVITRADVERAAAPVRPAVEQAPGREERIPVKGVRKHMAAAMVASAFSAPHVTEWVQVDVTETMAALRRLRELPEFAEVKVTPLLLVARALLLAVRRHPLINSTWDEAAAEIVVRHYVNLGIAVATSRGLVVPNVKDAHALALPELARAIGELTETARAAKTQPADMQGGTITITNVGVFGVDGGTPIINPGEVAILAVGQIRELPWVHRGELAIRQVTTLSLSFDHRVVDGELGSAVLRDVAAMLEDPLRMVAWG